MTARVIAFALDVLVEPGTSRPYADSQGVLDRVLSAGSRPVVVADATGRGRADEALHALGVDTARVAVVDPAELPGVDGLTLVTDLPGAATAAVREGAASRAVWVNRRDRRELEDVLTLSTLDGVPEALLC
ncbi:hypothetical protein [Arsenicicoccus dermatophilus]|uniref:hypothetical protein n=1 Tax=Arsenicicoccus dermatophilus TaxID=1076331 RepID=UPI001F4C9816|nr:hypothetical protein [Arsenicicoccus dermatophilus]MCH8611613.1 hypothetical protein [Arsenicicoccus dermatophilus]